MRNVIDNGSPNAISQGDRWTPVLNGDIFCSPACGGIGGRCKKADFDQAVAMANALAENLGDGWKPHVWENLGWHWEVKKGRATVSLEDGQFTAEIRFMLHDRHETGWLVLAKSKGGRYFEVCFSLCVTCAADAAHSGSQRLIAHDFQTMTVDQAKNALWRSAGAAPGAYRSEFGEAPPSRSVDG